ncbi:hypothetical protein X943_000951 [Babesia divergens]|uniref:Nucleoside transporter n=1 Tax=Babesia divergens TaxID=32595 RepID=A0AAD9GD02_BABDI|nr:hypothetical protein X943_000951 [Babesia divergens]
MDTSPKVLEIPKDEVVMEDDETIVPEKKYSQSMLNYMTLLAIMQGFAALINLNVVFMLAGMVPKALNVHPFSTTVVFIFEGVACVVNTIIFWTNPLKPWLTVSICYVQAAAHVFQIIVASLVNSSVGKYMYLFGTAVCGAAFGCNCMTSFALVAFAPVNKLGAFSFGCALGGVVPFLFSTAVQFTFFADETVASTKGMMCSMMTFVIILSVACAINLTIYLNNEDIKRHYAQVHSDGITSVKCTLRAAARGMKYTWKIVVIQFISYINILTFYPSILPLSMWVEFSYRIVLIGVFQFCDTLGRAIGVFVDPKWLPCNTLDRVIILATCNLGTTAFLVCSTIFHKTFLGKFGVILVGFIVFATVGGYCNSYADKSIGEHVPKHLDKETVVSTTSVFSIIISVFCATGSLIASFLVKAFPEPVVPTVEDLANAAAARVQDAVNEALNTITAAS